MRGLRTPRRARGAVVLLVAVSGAGVQLSSVAPGAAATRSATHHGWAQPAPDPLRGHRYRHGLVPRRGAAASGSTSSSTAPVSGTSTKAGSAQLFYGGGNGAVSGNPGVTAGQPKVYLVFWGSQWGTPGAKACGSTTSYGGDPNCVAPQLESFFSGLGTDGELWSGVMTQYCQGVVAGALSCPSPPASSGASAVGYPLGGALAGAWEDTHAAAPSTATATQIAAEALAAAGHFGNTTFASNRAAQYIVVSPTGTNPDDYQGVTTPPGFCAWHDYSSDPSLDGGGGVSSAAGPVAFTNLPYIPDAGASCGANFVNGGTAGLIDGVTLVGGHEYAETLTDQFPAGGWTDLSGNENADKCAWKSTGSGASRDLTLATGSFPVQTTWGNDAGNGAGGCQFSHDVVSDISLSVVRSQSAVVGAPVSLSAGASDAAPGSHTLTYSAAGLPAGLNINPATGAVTGTPTTAAKGTSATLFATDGQEVGSATLSWTVNPACSTQLLGNPGFEAGVTPWSASSGLVVTSGLEPSRSGGFLASFGKVGHRAKEQLSQRVTLAAWCPADTMSFWLHIDTSRTGGSAVDTLTVEVRSSAGTTVLATYSNLDAATFGSGYSHVSLVVPSGIGSKQKVRFLLHESTATGSTNFAVDDTDYATAA